MVLERAYGAFGGVSAVDARRNQLVIDILLGQEFLEFLGAFIVKSLQARGGSSDTQLGMEGFVCIGDALAGA